MVRESSSYSRLGRFLLVSLAVLATFGSSCGGGGQAALDPQEGEVEVGTDPGVVGRHEHYGIEGFEARGDKPVRFRAARVVGIPDGMELLGIRAVHRKEGEALQGGWHGDLVSPGLNLDFRRVGDVVLHPGRDEDYYLVVSVKANRPGRFTTEGLEVDWQAGKRKGTAFYEYLLTINVPA